MRSRAIRADMSVPVLMSNGRLLTPGIRHCRCVPVGGQGGIHICIAAPANDSWVVRICRMEGTHPRCNRPLGLEVTRHTNSHPWYGKYLGDGQPFHGIDREHPTNQVLRFAGKVGRKVVDTLCVGTRLGACCEQKVGWCAMVGKIELRTYIGQRCVKHLPVIFRNNAGTCSSSNGSLPQSITYKMTPHDQTSISGPAYNLGEVSAVGERGRAMRGRSLRGEKHNSGKLTFPQ